MNVKNDEGLLFYDGSPLFYLITHDEKVYDSQLGELDITIDDANKHNELLDKAIVKGLDENCEVGMSGFLYLEKSKEGTLTVQTWLGTLVSDDVKRIGKVYRFRRNDRTYMGSLNIPDSNVIDFERIT